jgi:hypothetical protein
MLGTKDSWGYGAGHLPGERMIFGESASGCEPVHGLGRLSGLGAIFLLCSVGQVGAATPEQVISNYPSGGRPLVELMGTVVAVQPEEAVAYCRAADQASRAVQAAVGAGFAFAYELLTERRLFDAAEHITTTACSCEAEGQLILASYAAARRVSAKRLCSGAIDPGSGPPPTLFYIQSQAGGGAVVVSPD